MYLGGGRYTATHESLMKNIKPLLISSVANHLLRFGTVFPSGCPFEIRLECLLRCVMQPVRMWNNSSGQSSNFKLSGSFTGASSILFHLINPSRFPLQHIHVMCLLNATLRKLVVKRLKYADKLLKMNSVGWNTFFPRYSPANLVTISTDVLNFGDSCLSHRVA